MRSTEPYEQYKIWTFVQKLLHNIVSHVAQVLSMLQALQSPIEGSPPASATHHNWLLKLHVQLAQSDSHESKSCKTLLFGQDRPSTWLLSFKDIYFACSTMRGGPDQVFASSSGMSSSSESSAGSQIKNLQQRWP